MVKISVAVATSTTCQRGSCWVIASFRHSRRNRLWSISASTSSAGWRCCEIREASVGIGAAVVFDSMFNPTSGARISPRDAISKGLEGAEIDDPIDEEGRRLPYPNEVIFCKAV